MSYEGREQNICRNGHYFVSDAYDGYDVDDGGPYSNHPKCPKCSASVGWWNSIDDTNGNAVGEILLSDLEEHFLVSKAIDETCPTCRHTEQKKPDVFRVPTREETDSLRRWCPNADGSALVFVSETR